MEKSLWDAMFSSEQTPGLKDFNNFIGSGLWEEFTCGIEKKYNIKPQICYSTCPMQRGWNIKYRKGGKALCTLYPQKGFFTALVVTGDKEDFAVRAMLPVFTEYTKKLCENTPSLNKMGKWLMVNVTSAGILKDLFALVEIKAEKENKSL